MFQIAPGPSRQEIDKILLSFLAVPLAENVPRLLWNALSIVFYLLVCFF